MTDGGRPYIPEEYVGQLATWTAPADVIVSGTLRAERLVVGGHEWNPALQFGLSGISLLLTCGFCFFAGRWIARIAIAEERWRVIGWLARIGQGELARRALEELPREEARLEPSPRISHR